MTGLNIRGEVNVEVLRLRAGGGRRVAEVPALRVGGRPVPFAAFRQIPCEPVVDWPSGLLKGEPLGRVHYFWGACAARGRFGHLHVVSYRTAPRGPDDNPYGTLLDGAGSQPIPPGQQGYLWVRARKP